LFAGGFEDNFSVWLLPEDAKVIDDRLAAT
jgi:hypothetical protein